MSYLLDYSKAIKVRQAVQQTQPIRRSSNVVIKQVDIKKQK